MMLEICYLEQPHQLIYNLLKWKKVSILHILTQKTLTSVFVKMCKYTPWLCKWTVTVHIYTVTVHRVNDFLILFFLPPLSDYSRLAR